MLVQRYGNDLNRIVEALRKKERESHRILLNPRPKLINKEKSVSTLKVSES